MAGVTQLKKPKHKLINVGSIMEAASHLANSEQTMDTQLTKKCLNSLYLLGTTCLGNKSICDKTTKTEALKTL